MNMKIDLQNNFEIEVFEDGTFQGKTPDGRYFNYTNDEGNQAIWIESLIKDGLGRLFKPSCDTDSNTQIALMICRHFEKERKATTIDKMKDDIARTQQARRAIDVAKLIISGIEGGLRRQLDEMEVGLVIGDIVESENRQYEVIELRSWKGIRGRLIRLDGKLGTQTKYLENNWKKVDRKGPTTKEAPTQLYVLKEIPEKENKK
jgi:hypothetical protein